MSSSTWVINEYQNLTTPTRNLNQILGLRVYVQHCINSSKESIWLPTSVCIPLTSGFLLHILYHQIYRRFLHCKQCTSVSSVEAHGNKKRNQSTKILALPIFRDSPQWKFLYHQFKYSFLLAQWEPHRQVQRVAITSWYLRNISKSWSTTYLYKNSSVVLPKIYVPQASRKSLSVTRKVNLECLQLVW